MAGLVDYSSSDSEGETPDVEPASKKRRLSPSSSLTRDSLPPLPATFRDLYSSTVRSSTQDDPSLHGGKKRARPHVPGNWPAHVYLEWIPDIAELVHLSKVVESLQSSMHGKSTEVFVHSLLKNELGVALPLHVSLSSPLVLRTEQKDQFLGSLASGIRQLRLDECDVRVRDMSWFPNDQSTRWFFVLRLEQTPESQLSQLSQLLDVSNQTTVAFGLPQLYVESREDSIEGEGEGKELGKPAKFHISIAWSLRKPPDTKVNCEELTGRKASNGVLNGPDINVRAMRIRFSQVKVRIGQDVTSLPLKLRRGSSTAKA